METLTVPQTLVDGFLSFAEVASLTVKQATDEIGVRRAAREKAAALVDPLLEHMLKAKVIEPGMKEAAHAMLGAHDTTLQLLKNAVDKIIEFRGKSEKTAGDLGRGEGDAGTSAGGSHQHNGEYNSLTHPIVGEKTANVKESDKKLLRLIGK